MKYIFAALAFSLLLWSCSDTQEKEPAVALRDTTITLENAISELFIDSVALANFVQGRTESDSIKILSFYNQRNLQMAWFFPDGLAEFVPTLIGMQNEYLHYSGDSSLYDRILIARVDSLAGLSSIDASQPQILQTELALTNLFFKYANKVYNGNTELDINELNWHIPRKKINTVAFLDSLIQNEGKNLERYEPINIQYNLLKNKLLECYAYGEKHWSPLESNKILKKTDQSDIIPEIRKRLYFFGDLKQEDSSAVFDSTFLQAVISFQNRMGLRPDGEIGPAFLREINVPIDYRIRQILINLERLRWLPPTPSGDYLLVNIPEYSLHVYEQGQHAFEMAVVVGSQVHNTVIFSGKINQVVFSPYWNIPNSILKNEILPGIRRNRNYLARHNMEWVGNRVRQKPGARNSLGLVKFLFPNSYNIYLHDTPSKSLFSESQRAFSHGCIRLSQPQRLAEFILRKDSTWTEASIVEAMNAGREKYVRLKQDQEVPVFIGYFTSWVDRNGRLNFRKDIYGHDQKMAKRLFEDNFVAIK
ncbi:L,D-transpeptidase family protein [Dyadobacter tibetensis]|uniref:L,D-transpeptidase family protein n=1 Tax=Dyadobacter tibetensis TaxID=1211851 RepID=UPI0004703B1A|nr:L,D-transpeptidase family protein [Dyadobacter tibetensis]